MSERRLESEDIDPSLYRMRGMAMHQLVWVEVEASSSSPLAAYISNRLSRQMSRSSGTRKYIAVSFAAAKRLKKLERVTGHSNSPCFGSFAKQVDLAAIGEHFDVLPTDSRDLGNSATQQVTPLNQGVVALSTGIQVSGSGDDRKKQAHLFMRKSSGRLLSVK